MHKFKKVIIILVVVSLVGISIAGGLHYMKKSSQKEVMVVNVSSLASTYYMPDTSLSGTITTSVSQNITVDKDAVIENVYVQEGDTVAVGDPLVSFDTTLIEMELNIAKLKKQKQEQDLNKAVNRLNSLQNGGPIVEEDSADDLSGLNEDESEEMADASARTPGNYLAYIHQPLLLSGVYNNGLFGDGSGFEDGEGEDGFSSGETPNPAPTKAPDPTPTPVLDEDTDYFDPYTKDDNSSFMDGETEYYEKLDETSIPLKGSGTEEDPYVFICSIKQGLVTVTGGFLNKMAGYTEDGSRIVKEGGYWYQLEFHENDTIADFSNRKESCVGYYLIDGSSLEKPVNMYIETEFTLEEADRYEPDDGDDTLPDDPSGNGGGTSSISRAEAIKIQQRRIASLKLDIQESDIEITKLQKKADKKQVNSKVDGTVSKVGDPLTDNSSGEAFITVKSKDGYYVKGAVSELLLDQVQEGSILSCTSYESGMFEAEVLEVSEYPISGDNYMGDGNPNVSYYSYSATIPDKTITFSDQDWVQVTLKSNLADSDAFCLPKAFLRSENGVNYVYREEKGVLKKQPVKVGGSSDGGYSVLIRSGVSMEDKIAFPYGSAVKEGAKTKEGTLEQLYGYY